MSHDTGYEVPSNDILDFSDNCENLDVLMNADQEYWTDRLGNKRPTIDYALRMAGFTPAGFDFTTGGVLQPGDRNKCVFNQADQTWYSWSGDLPYNVIAGSIPGEGWKIVLGRLDNQILVYSSIKNMVDGIPSKSVIGQRCLVEDYHGAPNYNFSGVLFFKCVPDNTGLSDGGRYIQGAGVQFKQCMKIRPDVTSYGALCNGISDDLPNIKSMLTAGYPVVIPDNRTCAVSDTVILKTGQKLHIGFNSALLKPTRLSNNTGPVVWVNGVGISVTGEGFRSSFIKTENKSPDGVLKIGKKDMSDPTPGPISHCNISGFGLEGSNKYGQTSGSPDVCIWLPSPQITGNDFNYFHQINNIYLSNANIGIWLNGFANGLHISQIYGVHIGNKNVPNPCLIYNNGALDNTITDIFFNQSPDSTGLIVDDLDNTPNGSTELMSSQHNSFKGMVFEHVGTGAGKSLVIRKSRGCYYEVVDATFTGYQLYDDFSTDKNTLISKVELTTNNLKSTTVRARHKLILGLREYFLSQDISIPGMSLSDDDLSNFITKLGNTPLLLNYLSQPDVTGRWLDLRTDGQGKVYLGKYGPNGFYLSGNGFGIKQDGVSFSPCGTTGSALDNTIKNGSGSARWSELFVVNNSINTSDEDLKIIDAIPSEWLNAARLITPIRFKWKEEVEKYTNGTRTNPPRWHVGYGAQTVFKILLEAGIEDPWECAFMCKDALFEGETDDGLIPIVDDNGEQIQRWGIRQTELNTLKIAALK